MYLMSCGCSSVSSCGSASVFLVFGSVGSFGTVKGVGLDKEGWSDWCRTVAFLASSRREEERSSGSRPCSARLSIIKRSIVSLLFLGF